MDQTIEAEKIVGGPKIEIPPIAREVKAWFKARPSDKVVAEIKKFIEETGTPHLWRGHTHTKPPAQAKVLYCGEFGLPPSHRARRKWAPCPCCTPEHPKYKDEGKIAWFPDERVIRLIGPRCYRTLNPEGHQEAMDTLRREEKVRRDTDYLLQHLPVAAKIRKVIEEAIPVAESRDAFRQALIDKLKLLRIPLWDRAREGQLPVTKTQVQTVKDESGKEIERKQTIERISATVQGMRFIRPDAKPYAPRLMGALSVAKSIDFGSNWRNRLKELGAVEKSITAKQLVKAHTLAGDVLQEMTEDRRFFDSIPALRRWGAREDSILQFHIELLPSMIKLGVNEYRAVQLRFRDNMLSEVRSLPKLSDTAVQADLDVGDSE